jgi:thiamine biosynthesis protein ThiI
MKTKPKALLLISGGIDSPVAGKLLQEKYDLEAIHFSQKPFTDNTPEKKSLLLCKQLGLKKMIVVEAGEMLKETYREYYFVLMKRFMLKVSEKIAEKHKYKFLITGESLGQVSSQTLSNLNTINQATKIEILRPLLFMNKQEIIDKSIEEEFFEISKGKEMCDALATGNPKTKTQLEELLNQEERCKMNELVEKALKKTREENTSQKIEFNTQNKKID